jgi:hypothetical protein
MLAPSLEAQISFAPQCFTTCRNPVVHPAWLQEISMAMVARILQCALGQQALRVWASS